MLVLVAGLVGVLGFGAAAPARGAQEPHSAAALSLPDQIELPRLIDLCAQRLGLAIDYDPKILTGTVTLRLGQGGDVGAQRGLTDAELWSLTNRLLASRGFTTVRQPGAAAQAAIRVGGQRERSSGGFHAFTVAKLEHAAALTWIEDLSAPDQTHLADAAPEPPPVAPMEQAFRPEPGYRSVIARVVNRPVRDAIESLKPLLSKSGGFVTEVSAGAASSRGSGIGAGGVAPLSTTPGASGGGSNSGAGGGLSIGGLVLISDLSPRVELALALLSRLDLFVESGVVEEVALTHLSAGQAIVLATSVASRREGVAGRKPVGELMASPSGDAVLIIAPADAVNAWRDLLARLDRREGVITSHYAPRHFALKDVARLISETVPLGAGAVGGGGVGGTPVPALDPGARSPTGGSARGGALAGAPSSSAASPPRAAPDDRFRIVIDDLTGALIITATASQHARIADLMARLDAVPPAARRPMRSYTLKNRPVREVIGVLSSMLAAGVLEASGDAGAPSESGVAPVTPGAPAAGAVGAVMPGDPYAPGVTPTLPARSTQPGATRRESGEGEESAGTARRAEARPGGSAAGNDALAAPALSLTSDEATNTLIAVGEPRWLAQLESLLVTLDVRQPQVMLEVLLLSLTDSQTRALGVELDKLTHAGDTQVRLSSVFGISTTNAGSATPGAGGTGGTVTVLSPAEFSIVVKALETLNQGRSLSVPRLLVSNNQKGDFTSNLQQPVQTSTTQNQTTTQGFAGYEQAGTTVSVQPRITEANHLLLQYNVTLSSFVGQGTGSLPPPRQENRLSSQVSIPDGSTVALGGIELTTTGEQTSQVPLLSAIPLIGEAFKSRSRSGNRSRFFVFIRAEVMRHAWFEDLKYAGDVATRDSGLDDGFPVVKPQVMR